MLFNLLAPEILVSQAISDRLSVQTHRKSFRRWSETDGVTWTSTHTYFANMGGFAISFKPDEENISRARDVEEGGSSLYRSSSAPELKGVQKPSPTASHKDFEEKQARVPCQNDVEPGYEPVPGSTNPPLEAEDDSDLPNQVREDLKSLSSGPFSAQAWEDSIASLSCRIGDIDWRLDTHHSDLVQRALHTVSQRHFTSPGQQVRFAQSYRDWCRNLCALRGDLWVVDATQLLLARELGIISRLPDVTEDCIEDRNKGDLFVKVVSISQIGWFVAQLIARLSQRLPTSQLEITTLAFCLCSGIAYALLLDKPKDATSSITIRAARRPETPEEMIRLALLGPVRSLSDFGRKGQHPCIANDSLHLGFDLETQVEGSSRVIFPGWAAAVFVFGAAHCIAWRFDFPTAAERVLWRASSVVTIAAPVILVLEHMRSRWVRGRVGHTSSLPLKILVAPILSWPVMLLYGASRLYVFVEAFRSLAFLPPAAFVDSWPNSLPHIGG